MRGDGRAGASAVRDVSTPVVVLTMYNHLGLGLVRSLGRLGIPLHCIHPDPAVPAMRSRYISGKLIRDFIALPAAENVEHLLGLGRAIGGRPVLLHTSDETAEFVAENAQALTERFRFQASRRRSGGSGSRSCSRASTACSWSAARG
jgi:hypothetical protein